jgi:hypothetical protein
MGGMKRPPAAQSLRARVRASQREIALALVLTLFALVLLWFGSPALGH